MRWEVGCLGRNEIPLVRNGSVLSLFSAGSAKIS